MINQIWSCNFENRYLIQNQTTLKSTRLNLLIGANNSGKSHFIRELFIANTHSLKYLDETLGKSFEKFHESTLGNLRPTNPTLSYNIADNQFTFQKSTPNQFIFPKTESEWFTVIENIAGMANILARSDVINEGQNFNGNFNKVKSDLLELIPNEQSLIKDNWKIPNRIYIPILRGLRPLHNALDRNELDELSSQGTRSTHDSNTNHCTRFQHRTIFDYFPYRDNPSPSSPQQFFVGVKSSVFTGHNLFEIFISNLLGSPEGRTRVGQYEDMLSNYFFEGQKVTIIPEYKKDQIAVKIGESEQRPIAQLGDGLQQIIIITSSIFFQTKPTLFFIEEPENSLHPWLLRRLATFMLDQPDHQYFITTHSNHLLDFAELNDDVSIYKFSKKKDAEQFEINDAKGDREILLELGVHASSFYLANCSIWVEGLTDRWYIEFYMKKYLEYLEKEDPPKAAIYKNFSLNHHYTFIEYGGGNVVHWDFGDDTRQDDIDEEVDLDKRLMHALRQTARALVIFDKDSLEKSERASEFETQLKENLYVYTEAKEIENLIPAEFIIKTAEKRLQSNRKDISKTIFNGEADKVDPNRFLKNEGIGSLLDDLLVEKGASDKTPYFAVKKSKKGDGEEAADIDKQAEDVQKNKTISRKSDFAKTAIAFMKSDFDPKNSAHMTAPIKELSEKIFTHIAASNPN